MPRSIRLQNPSYTVEVDPRVGRLTRLTDRAGKYELITEPRLGENWRLLLPLPDVQCNYILGSEQPATRITKIAPTKLEMRWDGPLRNERGEWDLGVTLTIELIDERVEFRCSVDNRTQHELAEVWYGIVGGMTGVGPAKTAPQTWATVASSMRHWTHQIFTDFSSAGQALGVLSRELSFTYPGWMSMPWASLYNKSADRGVFFAALEETARVKAIRFALEPGVGEMRPGGNWPRADEVGKLPRGLVMNWAHFPYTKPGETFEGSTIVLQSHESDWRGSARLYREWFESRFKIEDPKRHWIRRHTTFLHTMLMLPEDNINLTYKQIPKWAADAAKRGIKHVMLAGWQIGGHDRGYPQYTPDPRLGTWEELRDGLRACRDLGVRASFFVNCQPADMSTEVYRKDLNRYRFMDPHGEQYYVINYWGMGTLGARSKFTATPFYEINPAHPQVRKMLIEQFTKLVEIGADGLHIDKFFQSTFDFNPLVLQYGSPDRVHHEGCIRFIEELVAACRAINPEFCFSFEGMYDRILSRTQTLWWGPADSLLKEVFPHMAFTTGIEQPYDFNKVNFAMLAGDNLLIGPANYNRGADYAPMQKLIGYIAQLTRIREELFDTVCAGERLDSSTGLFQRARPLLRISGAFAKSPDARWTLFRDPMTGRQAAVLANLSAKPLRATGVEFANGRVRRATLHQPDTRARTVRLPASVMLPSERCVFVVASE